QPRRRHRRLVEGRRSQGSALLTFTLDPGRARRQSPPVRRALLVFLLGCGGSSPSPDAPVLAPTPNAAREIADTKLAVDVTEHGATATITFAPGDVGATLEVGDLMIDAVTIDGKPLGFAQEAGKLDLALPASEQPMPVTIAYHYRLHEKMQGVS